MDITLRDRVRLRGTALWCLTTGALAGIVLITLPTLVASPRMIGAAPGFADLLVTGCAAAALVAAGWLWVITTDVVVRVLVARDPVAGRRPGPVRLLVLAACGAVALSAAAAPASADERRPVVPHSLAGLPLPDRATNAARRQIARSEPDLSWSGSVRVTRSGRSPSSDWGRARPSWSSPPTGNGSTTATQT